MESITTKESSPFVIENSNEAGRFVVAARNLIPGETVLECVPYSIVVVPKLKQMICSVCFQQILEKEKSTFCNCKEIWYCSQTCFSSTNKETLHRKNECFALKKINNPKFKLQPDDITIAKLAIRILTRREEENNFPTTETLLSNLSLKDSPSNLTYKDVLELVPNTAQSQKSTKFGPELKRIVDLILFVTPKQTLNGVTIEEVTDLVCRIKVNSFGIWNKKLENSRGLAVYPTASFFNHSCTPNIARIQNGTGITFKTIRSVPKGTELCISYIEIEDDAFTRREILNFHYYFTCGCPRCSSNDSEEAFQLISPYLCTVKGCAGMLVPISLDSIERVCSGCGKKTKYLNVKKET